MTKQENPLLVSVYCNHSELLQLMEWLDMNILQIHEKQSRILQKAMAQVQCRNTWQMSTLTHGYQFATQRASKSQLLLWRDRLMPHTADGQSPTKDLDSGATHQKYSKEAFANATLEWIIADDQMCSTIWLTNNWLSTCSLSMFQSLNVLESMDLQNILLMLWQELKDSDIPHHLTIYV